jgi:hypothetical protein
LGSYFRTSPAASWARPLESAVGYAPGNPLHF